MSAAVVVNNLSVQFGDHQVLENLELEIPESSFLAIVGPNGAGKSTFLKVLLGLVKPTAGTVKLYQHSPNKVSPEIIGYVPQVKTMDRSFPAKSIELVLTGLSSRWPWKPQKAATEKAIHALKQVGAEALADRSISKLSGGELQRICLARSIVREPKIVMLDEPATGIDAVGEADLYRMLEDYQKSSQATIIMITHDWHAATHHADHVLLLNQKQISFGPPKSALNEDFLRIAFGHVGHKHQLNFLNHQHD